MPYYDYITEKRNDSPELKKVMDATAEDLVKHQTDELKPGMLLGLIQSGKTSAFIGVMAKCFDLGFDVVVVFTKNSVALAEQTLKRFKTEFKTPIEANKLYVWDIVKLQSGALTGYILGNKQIFIVKKESMNMVRLLAVFKKQKKLQDKRVLIIDDEADQAGVSFVADKGLQDGIELAIVAKGVSEFRNLLKGKNSYLQVTATPYSLYLQPENLTLNQQEYAPLRPAFTHVLHPHPFYKGGEYYFEESMKPDSPASFLHVTVPDTELAFLNAKPKTTKTYDSRILNNILESDKIERFRMSLLCFLVAGAIRQKQEPSSAEWAKTYHCSFIMHTATAKQIHAMQKNLVEAIIEKLKEKTLIELEDILKPAYKSLEKSVELSGFVMPTFDVIAKTLSNALENNFVGIIEVNSENQVTELLGEDGQLRLDNPFNIFVGGQSLDRGITIDHLIGFFYGRNPGKFQMDTVLQHSRMYGARSKEDLSVTRFYTSARIYEAMRSMHWFDKDLREDFNKFGSKAVVRFIAKSGDTIIPAGPNKLRASNLLSFKALSRLLPIGFQTRSQTDIKANIEKIDAIIEINQIKGKPYFELSITEAIKIINLIEQTFAYEPRFGNEGLEWDTAPFIRAMEIAADKNNRNTVIIYFKSGREISRFKNGGATFSDVPDDGKVDLPEARKLAATGPVLSLFKQKGRETDKWKNAPFYWPVLVMPANMPNYVYCEA